jgi:hypothetical protein
LIRTRFLATALMVTTAGSANIFYSLSYFVVAVIRL